MKRCQECQVRLTPEKDASFAIKGRWWLICHVCREKYERAAAAIDVAAAERKSK